MKYITTTFLLAFCIYASASTIIYDGDFDTNFPNPERGYCYSIDPPFANMTWSFCEQDPEKYTDVQWTKAVNPNELKFLRTTKGMSLVLIRYHIAEFRYKPLSEEFLQRLNEDFANVRKAGFKMIPHFTYNWVGGGPDAPAEIILEHLEQLRPIFQENVDVIAYVYSGLIGCWGEQHSSAFGNIDVSRGYNRLNESTIKIIEKIFDVVPPERMVNFRIAQYKFQYFNGLSALAAEENKPIDNITEETAYNQSIRSRWGTDEHCLVCSECNCGSYTVPGQDPVEIIEWLERENKFLPQGGEPGVTNGCGSGNEDLDGDGYVGNEERDDCERIRSFFERHKWSTINENFNWNVDNFAVEKWRKEGCYQEFARNLGYRFRMISAEIPDKINANIPFNVSITISNDGYAACYNERGVELVLRNQETNETYTIPVDLTNKNNDPRFWFGGEEHTLSLENIYLDTAIPTGKYDLFLNLYDPQPKLRNIPEYSIRCANINTWEATTGYNKLHTGIEIENDMSGLFQSFSNDGIYIIPNPVENTFLVEAPFTVIRMQLIDVAGRLVYQTFDNKGSLTDLPSGCYLLHVISDQEISYQTKIIKN